MLNRVPGGRGRGDRKFCVYMKTHCAKIFHEKSTTTIANTQIVALTVDSGYHIIVLVSITDFLSTRTSVVQKKKYL